MSSTIKTPSALAAFAVVALFAGPAIAGMPMNVVEKWAAADAMARNQQAKAKVAPKSMAKAEAIATVSDGTTVIPVPEELYHYLTASPDAKGHMQVRDTDSAGTPVATAVEASDEK
jgi:hypothetical protein